MNDLDLCLQVVQGYVNHCLTKLLHQLEMTECLGTPLHLYGSFSTTKILSAKTELHGRYCIIKVELTGNFCCNF